jgi:hypothetical protein
MPQGARISLDELADTWSAMVGEPKAHQLLLLYEAALAGEFEFPVQERDAAPLHPSTVWDDKGKPHTVGLPAVGPYLSALSLANGTAINVAQLVHGLRAMEGGTAASSHVGRARAAHDIFVSREGLRRWLDARYPRT